MTATVLCRHHAHDTRLTGRLLRNCVRQVMSLTASPYKKERSMDALVRKVNAYSSLSSSSSSQSLDEELAAAALAAELRGS